MCQGVENRVHATHCTTANAGGQAVVHEYADGSVLEAEEERRSEKEPKSEEGDRVAQQEGTCRGNRRCHHREKRESELGLLCDLPQMAANEAAGESSAEASCNSEPSTDDASARRGHRVLTRDVRR